MKLLFVECGSLWLQPLCTCNCFHFILLQKGSFLTALTFVALRSKVHELKENTFSLNHVHNTVQNK